MDNLRQVKDVTIWGTGIDWESLGLDPDVMVENSERVKARFVPDEGPPKTEPVAIVCYGPSLKDTWQEVRNFKTIFTCSGAHKFLIERGIIPTFHVESDPQPHKPKMLGNPHPDVTYLMASICHPTYFDLLQEHNAKIILYHLLICRDKDVFQKIPSGEWIMTGGNTVGVRTMKLAYLWKYHNQHIFGLDMSGTHADVHLKPPKHYYPFEYNGRTYMVTKSNAMHFIGLFTELSAYMPNLEYKFYGDGLVQAAVKNFKRGRVEYMFNAVMKQDAI